MAPRAANSSAGRGGARAGDAVLWPGGVLPCACSPRFINIMHLMCDMRMHAPAWRGAQARGLR
eukprot:10535373-Prorocentrum_lima.AAC.1